MKKSLFLSILGSFFMANTHLKAQSGEHFRASVAAGINLSQIEGDGQQGYTKIGASIGAKGAYCFKPNFDMSAELLYNSRGTRSISKNSGTSALENGNALNAELNYADVILGANFHFLPDKSLNYYRQSLQIGLAYGRLLSSKITTNRGTIFDDALQNNVKNSDFGFIVGYTWFPIQRLGICAKHTFSVRSIYADKKISIASEVFKSWIPYNLSIQLVYNVFSPKLNIRNQVEKAKKASEKRKKNPLEDL